ncbi:SDR family NAD(P)-dependent oxidoreductase [Bordetella sp. BOR01]|uniref:SDR family NAD(P)-dependent oxidoreductase n=1 Tax=Bordetella sp. BOR01 TaxID=2854779 RepID=UPI001C43DDE4|nr:SDR family NAD(P)-dependent oxidoreductase [Bordetella sp. BOR01]MBV7484875.1 SDR family oxidoreductase [Bordetella sp. BOR01]
MTTTAEQAGPRVALVTGASAGLGLDIARRLARDGCHVVLTATRRDAIEQVAESLRAEGAGSVEGMELDVLREDSVARLFSEIDNRHGRLDILVNNAGIAPRVNGSKSRVEETTLADWNRTLAVNLTGTFLVTRAALPLLKRSRSGRIVNISSRGGRTRSKLSSAHYAASKAGLLGFARILADEVGPLGITVNTVAPSRISTPMAHTVANPAAIDAQFIAETPLGRLGVPADVSAAVAFLTSSDASFLTGTVIDVAGGQFMP